MRVAIVSECFLPVVNGVTNSVLRVVEHLTAAGARSAVRIRRLGTCRLHGLADRTLAPSSWATEALRARGVPRVHQWARGVDTCRFTPSKRDADLRAELAPDGGLLIGYVGRLAPEKQVERLAVLGGLPGTRLVVVGAGPSEERLRAALPDAAFLGFRGGDELARIYASLDVFVHTGPSETFCQAVQEALASGVPVVAPDAGGPRDLVLPGRTGYLVPPRPEGTDADDATAASADAQLRAAVLALTDDAVRRRFGAAARKSVLRRTWTTVCDELLAHYAEVIGASTAPRAAA